MGRARPGIVSRFGAAHPDADRAARLDCRALADRRRRHYDLPRRSDDGSRDDGGHLGERLAVGRRTRGHHPGPAGFRPRHRGGRARGRRGRARHRRHRRRAGLYEGGVGTAGRAVARLRSFAQRVADTAHDRRQARLRRDAGFCRLASRACRAGSQRQPRRSPRLDRSHARHGGGRGRRRHRNSSPGCHRDGALGHLRDPRRHGGQPADRGSPALRRRHRRFRRQPISAPFSVARLQRRRHRRRRRFGAVRHPGCGKQLDVRQLPGARKRRPCSAHSRSGSPAISPSSS